MHRNRLAGNWVAALALLVVASLTALVHPTTTLAAQVYVSAVGSDTAGFGTVFSPYATVQHAVEMATSGDAVQVGPGMFQGHIIMKDGVSLFGAGAAKTTITGSGGGSVITASNIGTATTISGLAITGGAATNGGGINCSAASPNIVGVTIIANSADQRGGGMYCDASSSPALTDCTISGNTAAGSGGGGIYCDSSTLVLTDCAIRGNVAVHLSGGGIYCDSSTLVLTDCTIADNSSGTTGSGVLCLSTPVTVTDCTITGNSAGGYGGGFYTLGAGSSFTDCTITGNRSQCGGAIYALGTAGTVTRCTITGNSTTGGGAGLNLDNGCSPVITDSVIAGNVAGGYGGAICLWSNSSPTITNCTIANNRSNSSAGLGGGGAIYCNFYCSPIITNCTITKNTAAGNGGAIYGRFYSAPVITNCTVAGNATALGSGAGYYCDGIGTAPSITNCILWDGGNELSGCSASFSDVRAGGTGTNIDTDPGFVNASGGDYHLSPNSPCIDVATPAGAPVADKDGVARPQRDGFDIGAYEYVRPTTVALRYVAGAGGTISGAASQTVAYEQTGTPVTAEPVAGYRFVTWSDGLKTASRTDGNVTTNATYTAAFAQIPVSLSTVTRLGGASSGKLNKTYKLTGTVSRTSAPGRVTITLTRLVRGRYRSAGTTTVRLSGGRFSYSFKPKYKGTWHFAATYSGGVVGVTTYKSSKSGTKSVKVR